MKKQTNRAVISQEDRTLLSLLGAVPVKGSYEDDKSSLHPAIQSYNAAVAWVAKDPRWETARADFRLGKINGEEYQKIVLQLFGEYDARSNGGESPIV